MVKPEKEMQLVKKPEAAQLPTQTANDYTQVKDLVAILIKGDLKTCTQPEKIKYYGEVCKSLNLNPLTSPFSYMTFNGKEQLYANKNCAEQLRNLHGISVTKLRKEIIDDLYIVEATIRDSKGRVDVATGAINLKGLSGEARANAIMKAETKAKRRATLSLCGLGMLDETEVESIDGKYSVVDEPDVDHGTAELPEPPVEMPEPSKPVTYRYCFAGMSEMQKEWLANELLPKMKHEVIDVEQLIYDFPKKHGSKLDMYLIS